MRSSMVFPPPRRLGGHGAEAHSGLSDDGCSAATCGRARPFEALGSATQIPLDVEQHSLPEPFSFAALGARAEPVDSSTPTPATGCDFKIMSAVAVHTEMCTCWAQGVPTGPRVPAPASPCLPVEPSCTPVVSPFTVRGRSPENHERHMALVAPRHWTPFVRAIANGAYRTP